MQAPGTERCDWLEQISARDRQAAAAYSWDLGALVKAANSAL
jgi:hypothetical protein